MTSLELLDDLVKIGLGAVIAAVAGYFAARANYRQENYKTYIRRKRQLLDKVVESLNNFHKRYTHYRSQFKYCRFNEVSAEEREKCKQLSKEFRLAFDSFVDAEGYILTTGDKELHEAFWHYYETLLFVRGQLTFENVELLASNVDSLNARARGEKSVSECPSIELRYRRCAPKAIQGFNEYH